MRIGIDKLPACEQISHKVIREAVAALGAAKAEINDRKRDLIELEQTREAAEWRDAEAAEKAIAEGKEPPKTRSHVAAHDRATDEAKHIAKVAQLAFERASKAVESAIEQHGDAWAAEVVGVCESLQEHWQQTVDELTALYSRLSAAVEVARTIGRPQPGVRGVKLDARRDLHVEVARGASASGVADTGIVLAALAEVGKPEPPKAEAPVPTRPLMSGHSPLSDIPTVREEQAERRRFAERLAAGTGE